MSNQKINTIFIGTSDFGIPALKALIKSDSFNVQAVISQPDKKTGRKQLITPPPIKTEAKKYGIGVYQPEKISDYKFPANIDLILVVAYAQILGENILNIPKYGAINIHGSLLPKYRGAACVQAAIMNGGNKTGVTFIKMDTGLDTGDILGNIEIKIAPTDTGGSLYAKLSKLAGDQVEKTLLDFISKKIKPRRQDESRSSYAKKLKKQDGHIDFNKPSDVIERFIRAMQPWPGAFAYINTDSLQHTLENRKQITENRKILKILEVKNKRLDSNNFQTGELVKINNELAIKCSKDALIVKKLQLEGKKEINGQDFIKGYSKFIGSVLK